MSNIVDHVKEIATLVQKYQNQELYQKIVDLRDEIFEMRESNLALKEQVRELKQRQDIEDQLTKEGNHYYHKHPTKGRMGPYCSTCWDADGKLISLQQRGGIFVCMICAARTKS